MFVLMSCLDHLERHQPLGLDRNHQIVKHVCESFCMSAIAQQRSPAFSILCPDCTFLNGVGGLCVLGSSGAGSQAKLIVQPCLASMAWSAFVLYASLLPFEQTVGGAGGFRQHHLSNLHPLQAKLLCLGLYLNLPESNLCTPLCKREFAQLTSTAS